MDATDRARVSKLDQPLKAYASKAASGTYQGIKQLNNYVAKHRLIWPDPLHVAPVTLAGLPREIPTFSNNVELEESNVVQCAALSLSSLAYLAEMSKDPTPMADFFVRHQRTIFPWLSFIQRTFFDPGIDALKTPKRASEEISDPAILQLIADTSNFLDRTVQVYDLADHDLITSFVLDLWQSFLGMPLDVVQGSLPTVAGHVGNVVTALIHASAMDRKRCIVKKYGGPAVMARLYLSFVEQDLARVKLGEAEYGFSYLMLEQTLTMALTNLANDIFLGDPEGVMPEVFPRITAAVIWLIKNYDRVVAKKTSKVEALFGLPTIIAAYCQFIITYPPTPTFNPILVAFKQGFCKRLRSHLPKDGYRASDKMSNSPLREFLHRLGLASSMCPGILRQTKCLISMPTNPVHESYWKAFDDFAAPSGRLLDALYLSVSGNPQMCSVCHISSKQCQLKVCAGCRIAKHCSVECQRKSWSGDHQVICKLLRMCGALEPILNPGYRAVGLLHISEQERDWRKFYGFDKGVQGVLSSGPATRLGPNELPVLHCDLNAETNGIKRKRFKDYPEIFDPDVWTATFVREVDRLLAAHKMPRYLIVLSLPHCCGEINILSPRLVLPIAGVKY